MAMLVRSIIVKTSSTTFDRIPDTSACLVHGHCFRTHWYEPHRGLFRLEALSISSLYRRRLYL